MVVNAIYANRLPDFQENSNCNYKNIEEQQGNLITISACLSIYQINFWWFELYTNWGIVTKVYIIFYDGYTTKSVE